MKHIVNILAAAWWAIVLFFVGLLLFIAYKLSVTLAATLANQTLTEALTNIIIIVLVLFLAELLFIIRKR